MIIKNLHETPFNDLMDCFFKAFENYFVVMPTDKDYYKERWQMAMVDYQFSYGMFDDERLVGFIIHAIDHRNGDLIAYNAGTGVRPDYRGQKITKRIYEYAVTDLKKNGVIKCTLEVIKDNVAAINAYQGVGFNICKHYQSYSGQINVEPNATVSVKNTDFNHRELNILAKQGFYSWDHQIETIKNGAYSCYLVVHDGNTESYFIINQDIGYVAQLDVFVETDASWNRLFYGIKTKSHTIKINNVDERLVTKITYLKSFGLQPTIGQYEMERLL